MVSQRSMHRTFAPSSWLLGLAVVLWLAPGCGQDEGGRCQVDSDCASGLECSDNTGNGVCRKPGATGNVDAAVPDAAPDLPISGPETEPPILDLAAELTDLAAPAVDSQPAADAEVDASVVEAAPPVVDAQSPAFDSGRAFDVGRAIDVEPALDLGPAADVKPALDTGAIDTMATG